MKKNLNRFLKNTKVMIIAVLVLGYAGVVGWLAWRYEHLAPSRTTSAMLNAISRKSDYTSAYKLTATTFQSRVSPANFVSYFQPLASSNAKYTVLKQSVHGPYAVVSGVVNDLHGVNYLYEFHLTKLNGQWKVDATNVDAE